MTPTLADRLTQVQARQSAIRERMAEAKRAKDAATAQVDLSEPGVRESAEFRTAAEAGVKVDAARAELNQAIGEENALLVALGRGDERVMGPNGPEDGVDLNGGDDEVVAALKAPGALLSAMLERRKRDVPQLPDDIKRKPSQFGTGGERMALTPITTDAVDTIMESRVVIDLLRPLSVAIASGIFVDRIDTTKTRIPRFTDLPVAGWIPELGGFPKSGPGIEMVDVEPSKVGVITELSNEVFEDLRPITLAMLQTQLLRSVALAFDQGILFGDGTGASPTGVFNTTGVQALPAPVPLTNLAAFAQAIAKLIALNATAGALVMNPFDVGTLLQAVEEAGSNVPLWKASISSASGLRLPYFDLPIWPTPACPQGAALMYDPASVIAVLRRDADIALDPYYDFDHGTIGLRTYLRGDVVVGQVDAAVRIEFA